VDDLKSAATKNRIMTQSLYGEDDGWGEAITRFKNQRTKFKIAIQKLKYTLPLSQLLILDFGLQFCSDG